MKHCEPMKRNIHCDDHKSLNHHPEASPWLMNQSSHSSGTFYSAHMPFFQVRQSGVTRSGWVCGQVYPRPHMSTTSNILMLSSGIMSTSEGAYPGDCPRESMISTQRAATNGMQLSSSSLGSRRNSQF